MGCKTIGRFTYDNATGQALEANTPIQFTNKTISTKCVDTDGSSISIRRPGAYLILANYTFVATAAGAIETQMYRNGNAVPSMHAIRTPAADGDKLSKSYAQPHTIDCGTNEVVLNFKTVGATTERIASVTVIKVA